MSPKNHIDTIYTLIFGFRGNDEKVNAHFSPAEKERFVRNLDAQDREKLPKNFFIGNTLDGKTVGINLSKIQTLRILWDPLVLHGERLIKIQSDDPLFAAFFEGQTGLYSVDVPENEPNNLSAFCDYLQDAAFMDSMFLSFLDESREVVVLNIDDLLYFEFPEEVIEQEEKALMEEEGELDD